MLDLDALYAALLVKKASKNLSAVPIVPQNTRNGATASESLSRASDSDSAWAQALKKLIY